MRGPQWALLATSCHYALLLSWALAARPNAKAPHQRIGMLTGDLVSLSHCKDMKNNAIYFYPNYTQIRGPSGEPPLVTAYFDISRPAKSISKVDVDISYCTQSVTRACEHFARWAFGRESCMAWSSKAMPFFWSRFADTITPPLVCPFRQGHYKATNVTVDVAIIDRLPYPVENKEWNITVGVWDDRGDHWVCYNIVANVYRTRRHHYP